MDRTAQLQALTDFLRILPSRTPGSSRYQSFSGTGAVVRESRDWEQISGIITELLDSSTEEGLALLHQGFEDDPPERSRPATVQAIRGRRHNVEYIFVQGIVEQRATLERFLLVNDPAHPRGILDVGMQYRPDQVLLVSVAVAPNGNPGGDQITVSCMMVLEKAPRGEGGDDSTISKNSSSGFKTFTDSGTDWTSVEA